MLYVQGPSVQATQVCSPSPCESINTIIDDDAFLEEENPVNGSASTLATPVNESREKLFPSQPSTSGSGTPTPTPTTHLYASQYLFDNRLDELSGSSTNLQQRSMKSYLHTFDRRNSDTNYLLGRRSSGERMNLADEIRKLSEYLLMLADINTKLGSPKEESSDANNNKSKKTGKNTKSTTKSTTSSSKAGKTAGSINSSSSSSSNITTTTSTATSSVKTAATTSKTKTTTSNGKSNRISSLSLRLQQSIEDTPKLINGAPWRTGIKKTGLTSSSRVAANTTEDTAASSSKQSKASKEESGKDLASTRRARFNRINQMSRDVPIGVPNTHKPVNLEEAANTTKDCLLHLLEKYNESKFRNPMGRHQSISVDCWNVSDNLEYRSMSSINAFFQRHNKSSNNVRQLQAQLEGKASAKATDDGS